MSAISYAKIALDFVKALTWGRVLQIATLALITTVCYFLWFNREYVSGAIRPSKLSSERLPLIVSDKAEMAVNDVLKNTGYLINTVSLVSVNMEQNTRRVIYFKTTDVNIERQNNEFLKTHVTGDIPLFNDDPENNKRIIRLINGEIVCVDYTSANVARYLHDIVDVKYVCSTGIPPYFGRFRGTVLVFLKVIPDAEEQVRLRILMRELADKLDNPSSIK